MGLIQSKSRASLGFGAPAVEAPLPCFSCDRPKRQPLPQSLLETCVRCIAKNLDELAERIAAWNVNALPVDLIQAVFDELVALRQLTPRLAMLFEHQFFDRLELDAYPGVDRCFLSGFRNCAALRVLDLSRCAAVDDVALRPLLLPSLRHLKLSLCVQVTDAGLAPLSSCGQLVELVLDGCDRLSSDCLAHVAHCTCLRWLNLERCSGISGGLHHLAKLTGLTHVSLGWCFGLTTAAVAPLSCLTALEALCLAGSRAGELPGCGALQQLQSLNLAGCMLSEDGVQALSCLQGLRVLKASRGRLSNAGAAHLAALSGLRELDLGFNPGLGDAGVQELAARLSGLTSLSLEGCQAVGSVACRALARGCKGLEALNVADTQVNDYGLEYLCFLTALRSLNLFYCPVSDVGAQHLSALTALTRLNLDCKAVTCGALRHLAPIKCMRHLDLFGAAIRDAGAAALAPLTQLRHLEMCGGLLTDVACAHVAKLPRLRALNVSQNSRITSAGVRALAAGLPRLRSLNLDGTGVSASVVGDLARLTCLETLALVDTRVGAAGVETLQRQLKNGRVKHNAGAGKAKN